MYKVLPQSYTIIFDALASFLIEVDEFLKTLSKQQSPKVAKQRQTDHQNLGIYPNMYVQEHILFHSSYR